MCASCPLSPPGATQSTPANFPEASTPARCSAASQTTSSRLQLRLLSSNWRSPESQVRVHLHTLSNHCGPQPWGSICPGFRSPRSLLRTTCAGLHRLGDPRVACIYTASAVSGSTQPSTRAMPSRFTQCLIPAPTLPAHSSSRPGCALWFTHFAILSMAKGNLVILLQPYGVCSLTPFSVFGSFWFCFFFYFLLGQYSSLTAVSNGLQAEAAGCAGRGPGRREGVAWAGKAECLGPGLPPPGNRGLRPRLLFQLTIGQPARDADA